MEALKQGGQLVWALHAQPGLPAWPAVLVRLLDARPQITEAQVGVGKGA